MKHMANSIEGRDIAYHMHPAVNLRKFEETGGLVIERGEGVYVYDNSGKRYIEGLAGLWSVGLGFGEKRLVKAAQEQLEKLPYYHSFNYKTNGPSVDLAELLIKIAPVPMSKVHFTSSGSEANDLTAKMVWYRSNALGKPEKKKIIGRIKGYHGVTIASGSITGLPAYHKSFDLPLDRMVHTSCPSYVHFGEDGESEEDFTARMLKDLEDLILSEGPETVAAFWGEPVIGAGGVLVPPKGYWKGVQEILRKYDILLVADEVICGFGRTGKMFACETYDIKPDVLVVSKQISSSYMPLSAIIMNDNFYQPIADESDRIGVFAHGFTASGHPVATAVGLENVKIILERDLVGNVASLEKPFLDGLAKLAEHPLAHSSRGVGLLGALELNHWEGEPEGAAALAVATALQAEGGDHTQYRQCDLLLPADDHHSRTDRRDVRGPWPCPRHGCGTACVKEGKTMTFSSPSSPSSSLAEKTDLGEMTAAELSALFANGKASPVEAAKASLERIEKFNPTVNAFAYIMPEMALAEARASEARWQKGEQLSPIDGAPTTIKELTPVKGIPWRRGSVLGETTPSDKEFLIMERLRGAGVTILGHHLFARIWLEGADPWPGLWQHAQPLAYGPGVGRLLGRGGSCRGPQYGRTA